MGAAIAAALFNLVVVGALVAGSPLFHGLVLDNLGVTCICSLIVLCLGLDTLFKYRWPGSTAAAHARKPRGKDLTLVAVAFGQTLLNIVAMFVWLPLAG